MPQMSGVWEIPQADDFAKIIDFPLQVAAGFSDSGLIAGAFDFSERQSSYYRRAAQQMGLVYGEGGTYYLTDAGRDYVELSQSERQDKMIANLLKQPVVRFAIERALQTADGVIAKSVVIEAISKHGNVGGETVPRRALSVVSWLRWLQTTLGELRVKDRVLRIE